MKVSVPRMVGKVVGLLCCSCLSLAAYSQADTTQPAPTFLFSKYRLAAPGSSPSFYSLPVAPAKYKIHYKIKTLTFPSDPTPKRTSLVSALINGYFDNKEKENNTIQSPFKKP